MDQRREGPRILEAYRGEDAAHEPTLRALNHSYGFQLAAKLVNGTVFL
jgi:hypothetical protein